MRVSPFIPYNTALKERAREIRKNPTSAEIIMWDLLLYDTIINKFRFLRQKPIDQYIVDFFCSKIKLAIEIDGSVHDNVDTQEYDKARTETLKKYGIKVIRFTNDMVMNDINAVKMVLEKQIEKLKIKYNI